ncbi:MAG: methyltransferase domain-containing protein [Hyphomicrobiales bacterium]|nr:MAG: methyltransferase domain-containing protein [Hyphomicrobiales bacterium]
MTLRPASNLACPMDDLPLDVSGSAWRCARGHSFDVAQEGYCNLLLVQQKASRDPGDSKAMVAARHRFLEAGHFAPIADRLYFQALGALAEHQGASPCVLDAGCGEGYYLARFADLAEKHGQPPDIALAGMDVSKWAVKAAAKRGLAATFVVGSNKHPPFLPGSVDLILSVFGFPHWEGFARVLAGGGHVLLADPGPEHLAQLREVIYPTVRASPPPSLDAAGKAGFALAAEETLLFSIDLEGQQAIQDLLLMTPHGARVPQERRGAIAALERLTVTIDVTFRLVAKRAA